MAETTDHFLVQIQEPPQEPPMAIEDMPQMAQFVYDFYNARIHQLMRMRGFSQVGLSVSQVGVSVSQKGVTVSQVGVSVR